MPGELVVWLRDAMKVVERESGQSDEVAVGPPTMRFLFVGPSAFLDFLCGRFVAWRHGRIV